MRDVNPEILTFALISKSSCQNYVWQGFHLNSHIVRVFVFCFCFCFLFLFLFFVFVFVFVLLSKGFLSSFLYSEDGVPLT